MYASHFGETMSRYQDNAYTTGESEFVITSSHRNLSISEFNNRFNMQKK